MLSTSFLRQVILLLFAGLMPDTEFNPVGNPPTGTAVHMFSSGTISDRFGNRDMAISPQGDEMFWTLQQGQVSAILHSVKGNSGWSAPEVASFSGVWTDLEPAFSPDGNRLYFVSRRPVIPGELKKDFDIWMIEKKLGQWTSPVHLPSPLNSPGNEFFPSVNRKGDVFFTRDVGESKVDILVSRTIGENHFDKPASLPFAVNSKGFEFNAFVDPDENFIVFTAYGRADDLGGGDLYMSVKNSSGEWAPALHFDSNINSAAIDYCPYVSPDKKYFFFTSSRSSLKQPFEVRKTLAEIKKALEGSNNGSDDIYWMEFSAINKR